MWAVVPVKEIRQAKQRLAPEMSADERRRLVEAMLSDVLEALSRVDGLEGVLVVTRDSEASVAAREQGAAVLEESDDRGLNGALEQAAAHLDREGADGLLIVPGDVPALCADEVAAVVKTHKGSSPALSIAPDRHGRGTNCLACSPPNLIRFRFGIDSFTAHQEEARAAGVVPSLPELPSLCLDVDTPEDLARLSSLSVGERTLEFLDSRKLRMAVGSGG